MTLGSELLPGRRENRKKVEDIYTGKENNTSTKRGVAHFRNSIGQKIFWLLALFRLQSRFADRPLSFRKTGRQSYVKGTNATPAEGGIGLPLLLSYGQCGCAR